MLDCGVFQGLKNLRLRNWNDPRFDPERVDAVVLSHAHIDHSGYLPVLARRGFRGPVHCTAATADLLGILLRDAGRIQQTVQFIQVAGQLVKAIPVSKVQPTAQGQKLGLRSGDLWCKQFQPEIQPVPLIAVHQLMAPTTDDGDSALLVFTREGVPYGILPEAVCLEPP